MFEHLYLTERQWLPEIGLRLKKKKPNFDRTKSTMNNIRFEDELLEKIEKAAGKGNCSKWLKEAYRLRL
ncbi:DUF3950 domain-containing protein [Enterobacter asburiae]|nr:DUF3950 domain-containing protein [Enterobacter asburiae]KAA0530334.1 DUF3950 domain-containing protein [Enterobacter dykesii]RTN77044.1 DUF3950 domain-containing protein [Enterobacter asburiae]RTP75584.1 DUF3950 domain-containing protein [Enterobacter asburiae]